MNGITNIPGELKFVDPKNDVAFRMDLFCQACGRHEHDSQRNGRAERITGSL